MKNLKEMIKNTNDYVVTNEEIRRQVREKADKIRKGK
jgi:hypothetical protein